MAAAAAARAAVPQAAVLAATAAAGENLLAAAQARMVSPGGMQYGTYPERWSPDRYDNAGPWFLDRKVIAHNWTDAKVVAQLAERGGTEWWRGKAKGMLQLLFERGHINPADATSAKWCSDCGKQKNKKPYEPTDEEVRTQLKKLNGKRVASALLAAMDDFLGEVSIVEKIFLDAGHLVQASPRYHPDLAGAGIEYAWGKAKLDFRRYINDLQAKNLRRNVLTALGDQKFTVKTATGEKEYDAPLPLNRVRRFARRARTNRLLFQFMPTKEVADSLIAAWKAGKLVVQGERLDAAADTADVYQMIDAMYQTHRNMVDVSCRVCDDKEGVDHDRDLVAQVISVVDDDDDDDADDEAE